MGTVVLTGITAMVVLAALAVAIGSRQRDPSGTRRAGAAEYAGGSSGTDWGSGWAGWSGDTGGCDGGGGGGDGGGGGGGGGC